MNKQIKLLAFDLGASSGRGILATFDGRRINLEEIHRFSNEPVKIRGNLYWDILRLFYEIKQGILKCINSGNEDISGIGIDTWGVDFGLLDENGNLISNPYHYRDNRTEGMMNEAFRVISKNEIFENTGIQFLQFNTIYQLLSIKKNNQNMLKNAKTLLLIPDLLNYYLTGIKITEFTNATTTQLFNPVSGIWSNEILKKLDLNEDLFTDVIHGGKVLGNLSDEICKELDVNPIPVISVASHDTGSAVASVPVLNDQNYVYISCGTWSLMGVELDRPLINKKSLSFNFTNEGGINNSIRFLKNIMGLWLVQESKRQWEREGEEISFSKLGKMARDSQAFRSYINPDHHTFIAPGNIPDRIREYCRNTSQPVPQNKGEIIRCILESLAFKYRYTLECLEDLLGRKINVVHMVGGGIKDTMLCQFTANATGREVVAGPIEATSIGNIIVQCMALNKIDNLKEARQVVRDSFPVKIYKPENLQEWNIQYNEFKKLGGF